MIDSEEDSDSTPLKSEIVERKSEFKMGNEKEYISEQDYLSQAKSQKREFLSFSLVVKLGMAGLMFVVIVSCANFFLMMIDFDFLLTQTLKITSMLQVATEHHSEMLKCLNAVTLNQLRGITKFDGNSINKTLTDCPQIITHLTTKFKKVV